MDSFGAYLKTQRDNNHLSLKSVYERTGISDSKLSFIERGKPIELKPAELKKIAHLYAIPVVSLFIKAGYLDAQDLFEFQRLFRNAELLTSEEKEHIQQEILLFTKGREISRNDL